jgi:endo-1,4-beta-xylanase
VPVARGALLGFDLQVNDATAGARTAAATWHDPTSLSYLNTSRWGVIRLG